MRSWSVALSLLGLLGCPGPSAGGSGTEGAEGSTTATTIIEASSSAAGRTSGGASCVEWPPPSGAGRFVSVTDGAFERFATRPRVSAEGRYVLFTSLTSAADPSLVVLLHDAACEATDVLSFDGLTPTELATDLEAIELSADASTVVFTMRGPAAGQVRLYGFDVAEGGLQRLDVTSEGEEAQGNSGSPSVSADGRFVAFVSSARLTDAEPPGDEVDDVFVRDRIAGTTELVDVDTEGVKSSGDCGAPSISADGRLVAFEAIASNLSVEYPDGGTHAYVRDRQRGVLELASPQPPGLPAGTSTGWRPSLSSDGRFVAFSTDHPHLPEDEDATPDVYVLDRQTGALELQLAMLPVDPGPAGVDVPRLSARAGLTLAIVGASVGSRAAAPVLFDRETAVSVAIDAFDPAALSLGEFTNLRVSDDGRWLVTALTSSQDPQVPQTAGSAVWMLPVETLLP